MSDQLHTAKRSRIPFIRFVGSFLFRLLGWRVIGQLPDIPKFVAVVAPHTSNWDVLFGFLGAATCGALELPYAFMIKNSALKWPVLGPFLRWLGGLGINRSGVHSVVEQVADAFARHPELMIAITPEGTRQSNHYWKSGFYYIAALARVPILPAAIDYGRRALVIGEPLMPTNDLATDVECLRQFFAPMVARYPEQFHNIRLKEQDAVTSH